MAQFQVYRVSNGRLVLDLQTDLIDTGSRVVAPLIPISVGPRVIGRLEPVFEIEGDAHALHTAEMAAIPSALLKAPPSLIFPHLTMRSAAPLTWSSRGSEWVKRAGPARRALPFLDRPA